MTKHKTSFMVSKHRVRALVIEVKSPQRGTSEDLERKARPVGERPKTPPSPPPSPKGVLLRWKNSTVICPDNTPLNDATNMFVEEDPCQQTHNQAVALATSIYEYRRANLLAKFDSLYRQTSLTAPEQFSVGYNNKEYHYTLYYYDQAGNKVKTVPPKGVYPVFRKGFLDSVKAAKDANVLLTPQHTLASNYRYNSLNALVAKHSPDEGLTEYEYDVLGRLVTSINAKQRALTTSNHVDVRVSSYTEYDDLGRISEVGQFQKYYWNGSAWIYRGKSQITHTVYDEPYTPINGLYLTQSNLRNRVSYSYTKRSEQDAANQSATYYSYDIHGNVDTLLQDYAGIAAMVNSGNRFKKVGYAYDLVSGKVNQVSYQPSEGDAFYHRYEYDAENRLTEVHTSRDGYLWQRDAAYYYYKHGPLARTVLGQLQVQGLDYSYTLQGWIKGVNGLLAGMNVTGNENGGCAVGSSPWDLVVNHRDSLPPVLTARNSITLAEGFNSPDGDVCETNLAPNDPACVPMNLGTDGHPLPFSAESYPVTRDAFGYSLHYYEGDYEAIGSKIGTSLLGPIRNLNNSPSGGGGFGLYNGNIAAMGMNIPKLGDPLVYSYQYDQLNRLVGMNAYSGLNNTGETTTFSPVRLDDYMERISYDPNGNILGYLRNGDAKRLAMDSLTYHYQTQNNRLDYVTDAATDANTATYKDYNDIQKGQVKGNYLYDSLGNLVKDRQEGIDTILWNVYGKIDSIKKANGTGIKYVYDATGNRISKEVTAKGVVTGTYYVRDATGNVMSVYTNDAQKGFVQAEVHVYGSSRLGILGLRTQKPDTTLLPNGKIAIKTTFNRNEMVYELPNYLGNTLATINDSRIPIDSNLDGKIDYYLPSMVTAQDYYPFGMPMPNRTLNSSGYRYGFGGKELDKDISEGKLDFGARIYDSRLGRWLSLDPLSSKLASQNPFNFCLNNPILFIDPDGAYPIVTITKQQTGKTTLQRVIGYLGTSKTQFTKVPLFKVTVTDTEDKNFKMEFYVTRDAFAVKNGDATNGQMKMTNVAFEPKDAKINHFTGKPIEYPAGDGTKALKLYQNGSEVVHAESNQASVDLKYRNQPDVAYGVMLHVAGVYKHSNGTTSCAASEGCFGITDGNSSASNPSNEYSNNVLNKLISRADKSKTNKGKIEIIIEKRNKSDRTETKTEKQN